VSFGNAPLLWVSATVWNVQAMACAMLRRGCVSAMLDFMEPTVDSRLALSTMGGHVTYMGNV